MHHKVLDGSHRGFENGSLGLLQIDETRGSTLNTEICLLAYTLTATSCGQPDGVRAHRRECSGAAGLRRWRPRSSLLLTVSVSVVHRWSSDTTRHPRSTCLERSHSIVGRQDTSSICVTILGNCLQPSQRLPMRETPRDVQFEFVSLLR